MLNRISWESATLGFWFTDLLDRNTQFNTWLFQGKPNVFWMTGFFNPQVNKINLQKKCLIVIVKRNKMSELNDVKKKNK